MFQAPFAVNVETGGMFLRITQNGEFVPALVALTCACLHVHIGRALLFSFPCRSQRYDISRIGSSQKVIRTVSHTFPKLGSGAMGSRFREQLTHWTDPAVFTQPDQRKGFLSAMVTAHEAERLYMRNFLEEITKNKYNQGGLTLKDLKPDIFQSNEKSKLSFRQWSDEFSSWVERIDQHIEKMLRLAAQMQEWDKDKIIAEAQQEYRLGAEKVSKFDKHIYLAMKTLTAGIGREIVDTPRQQEKLGTDSPTGSMGGTCKARPPLPVNSKS